MNWNACVWLMSGIADLSILMGLQVRVQEASIPALALVKWRHGGVYLVPQAPRDQTGQAGLLGDHQNSTEGPATDQATQKNFGSGWGEKFGIRLFSEGIRRKG